MTDLTKADVQEAVRAVLLGNEFEERIVSVLQREIVLIFGASCSTPQDRQENWIDMKFLRATRQAVESASSKVAKGMFVLIMLGLMAIAGIGASSHDGIQNIFR